MDARRALALADKLDVDEIELCDPDRLVDKDAIVNAVLEFQALNVS